jgi:hypothetical protein
MNDDTDCNLHTDTRIIYDVDTRIIYDVTSCVWYQIEARINMNIPFIPDILVNAAISGPMRASLNEYEHA